jgi:hypothetical protein
VATVTISFGTGKVSLVAFRTLDNIPVAARQFKACGDMVKGRWFPCRGGVACFAIFCDPGIDVVWNLGTIEIGQMATVAGRGCAGEAALVTA